MANNVIVGNDNVEKFTDTNPGKQGGASKICRVVLSLDTNIYASGDVLADTQQIANVTGISGGKVMLTHIRLLDKDDQAGALALVFLDTNTALGTENNALAISDTDAEEIQTNVPIYASDYKDLGGCQMVVKNLSSEGMGVIMTASGTSLYVGAISRDAKTYSAAGIVLEIGFLDEP